MSNLIEIQGQIEKLQKQANDIKTKEFDKTVQEIVAKMQAFGITAKHLQANGSRSGKSKAKAKTGKGAAPAKRGRGAAKKGGGTPVAAKYRGPNGESWSGRGLTPKWLAALTAQGQSKEEFAIKH